MYFKLRIILILVLLELDSKVTLVVLFLKFYVLQFAKKVTRNTK